MKRTVCLSYLAPTKEEMRQAAKAVELKNFSPSFVVDLCNMAAGGKILPPSTYREAIRCEVEENFPSPDSNGEWSLPLSGGHTKDCFKAIEEKTAKKMQYHQSVCDFLQAVEWSDYPGNSPLEQAMYLLKVLSTQKGGEGAGEGSGESLPIFTDNDNPERVAREMSELLDTVDSLLEEEKDMLDPDRESESSENESDQDGERSGSQGLSRLKIAKDLSDPNKAKMLEVSRTLDQFTKLQVRKSKKQVADPEGNEVRQRAMRDLSEFRNMSVFDTAMYVANRKYFMYRAVTGQVSVTEKVTTEEKKQAIFILIDGSGSMSGEKHYIASGIVMNRLKAVIAGDAVAFVSVFDTEMKAVHKAETPEEAKELMKKFTNGNFSGGGTDIAAGVKEAHKYIEELMKHGEQLWRPEVCVLTDEDSSADGIRANEIPGTKVHGFAIKRKNENLMKLANSTGGAGIENFS